MLSLGWADLGSSGQDTLHIGWLGLHSTTQAGKLWGKLWGPSFPADWKLHWLTLDGELENGDSCIQDPFYPASVQPPPLQFLRHSSEEVSLPALANGLDRHAFSGPACTQIPVMNILTQLL